MVDPPREQPSLPSQRDLVRKDLNVAQLTAKAELVMEELAGVITDMAELLRRGASNAGPQKPQ